MDKVAYALDSKSLDICNRKFLMPLVLLQASPAFLMEFSGESGGAFALLRDRKD